MPAVPWQSIVDFLVLTVAVYFLLKWSRQARALRLAMTILALRVGALLARQLDLLITNWVLDGATVVALLALVVVFQPELRRAVMQFDITGRVTHDDDTPAVAAVTAAACALAQARCGALIVLERKDSLRELVTSGVTLSGRVSAEILESIFQERSPVHDGAAIVQGELIARVGAILPLTQRSRVDERYGTRHRAALGLSERCDAVVIVVSEERGEVSVMWEGRVQLVSAAGELQMLLTRLTAEPHVRASMARRLLRWPDLGLRVVALVLSAFVWTVTFLFPGRAVRVQTVPVEFTNVPAGLTITAESTDTVQLWLRGSEFLFDSVNLDTLVARCDLTTTHEGLNNIPLQPRSFDVPFGLKVESMAPREIKVELTRHR